MIDDILEDVPVIDTRNLLRARDMRNILPTNILIKK